MSYIPVLSLEHPPLFPAPRGGRGSRLEVSIYTYCQPSPAGGLIAPAAAQQPRHLWCYCLPLTYTETVISLYVCSLPLLHINSEHFWKYERNKIEILWRSLFTRLFTSRITTTKAQFNTDITATNTSTTVIHILHTVAVILL